MQYLGGKSRIARHIAPIILEARGGRSTYLEPFLGAGSVFTAVAPSFERAIGADVVPDLIMLWEAVADGWVPPTTLTEREYAALRYAEPSALRGFAGFPCSFGGKWFGGYARDPKGGSNFAASASRSLCRKVATVPHAKYRLADFRDHVVDVDTVVYADPPYAGTTPYAGAPDWDAEAFWDRAREWDAVGAVVMVSEYHAPADWVKVWEGTPRTTLARNHKGHANEGLYTTPRVARTLSV